ncbi:MAG: sugar-binding transcriptional regulator [Anaerolineae bacterium]|nr:sugar-binding transcriptional regulator [Anaerolineae bacterium]
MNKNVFVDQFTRRLLYKIAQAYYEDGLTQEQVARRLGISRIKVSRYLRQARELKIVQITLLPFDKRHADLERQIEQLYDLDEVIVVSAPDTSRSGIAQALGPAAADCLLRGLGGEETVALTWGGTLLALVNALSPANYPKLRVVQCIGGLSRPDAEINGADLVRRMAQILGGKPLLLPAPGMVESAAVCGALLADAQIADTLRQALDADVAVVGIGTPFEHGTAGQHGILTPQELERLRRKGAVGEIGLRFFGESGDPIEDEINGRVVGLGLKEYASIRRVICVAGGEEKFSAIQAALHARLVHVLVTDEHTAAKLLETHFLYQQPSHEGK